LKFDKLHGLGNDFLILRESECGALPLDSLARKICERHCGVGADGILVYRSAPEDPEADFYTVIINADGSAAEVSGNGVRCLAASLHYSGEYTAPVVGIRTVSGVKRLTLQERRGGIFVYRSSLGYPITDPDAVPARFPGQAGPIVAFPLDLPSGTVRVTVTSMGNPHCSTFWPDVGIAPLDELGPVLECHHAFPNRTNVEFVQVVDPHRLRVRFWERGAGHTLASGTGSAGAAVAAVLNGLAASPMTVETALGDLLVEWEPGAELFLTGRAEFICSGDYRIPENLH
jgi:diaminopimelate epimerase